MQLSHIAVDFIDQALKMQISYDFLLITWVPSWEKNRLE